MASRQGKGMILDDDFKTKQILLLDKFPA